MRTFSRTVLVSLAVTGGFVLFAGCGSSDNNGGGSSSGISPGFDGGGTPDAIGADGNTPSDTGGGTDTGVDSGGGPVVKSCDAAVRIDSLRGVNGSVRIGAAGNGDKWVAAWFQIALVSPDSQFHLKARSFDGTALGTETDLGIDNQNFMVPMVGDGNGHAFLDRNNGAGGDHFVYDFAAGTWGASTPFPVTGSLDPFAQAAFSGGGAISLYRNGTNELAEKWLPADPTWKSTGLLGLPAAAFGLRISTAVGTTKASAVWYSNDGSGGSDLSFAMYDGATWSSVVTKNIAGTPSAFETATFSNGDMLGVWVDGSAQTVHAVRVHPNGTFDAVVDLGTAAGGGGNGPLVVIDAQDRVTVAWSDNGTIHARRNLGSSFGATDDFGAGFGFRLDLDPKTSNVALVTYKTPSLIIRGIGGADAAWTSPVTLNAGISNQEYPKTNAAVVFDSAGKPTVITMQDAPGAGGLELFYVKCK